MSKHIPRIFVTVDMQQGGKVQLTQGQSHYLTNVMRLLPGDEIRLFNGRDGEWSAVIKYIAKQEVSAKLMKQNRLQPKAHNLRLLCAPLKQGRTEAMIEKVTELGVSHITPILTERTIVRKINLERLSARAREAAEQCERLTVPRIDNLLLLKEVLYKWPSDCELIYCSERQGILPLASILAKHAPSFAVLIGPEGGFSEHEHAMLEKLEFVRPVSLGANVLRADTAAIVAIAGVVLLG